MAISPRLGTRQTQQLAMTPELRQSIKLLQFTSVELQSFISAEIEKNPLLEQASDSEDVIDVPPARENREVLDDQILKTDPFTAQAAFDGGAENLPGVFSDNLAPLRGQSNHPDTLFNQATENIAGAETLKQSLHEQVGLMPLSDMAQSVVWVLIEELDDDGYLRLDLSELSQRLGVSDVHAQQALAALQSCDPSGVGARDLSECLKIQASDRGDLTADIALVLDRLDRLAQVSNEQFAKEVSVPPARVAEILDFVRTLNPSPGLIFDHGHTELAVPEIHVFRDNLGGWTVELNPATLPKLLINNQYSASIDKNNEQISEYISKCTSRAKWLINSLDQRANTILRVSAEIVRQQDQFFSSGISALRPMTLRDIAEKIDVHESTVSRVTAGKYLICSLGTFELKFFFSNAVKGMEGDQDHSSRSVQEKIRRLIDLEDPKKTLSDESIVRALSEDGINIARRTVTKYREAMRIPSSVQRRRRKFSQVKNSA